MQHQTPEDYRPDHLKQTVLASTRLTRRQLPKLACLTASKLPNLHKIQDDRLVLHIRFLTERRKPKIIGYTETQACLLC